MIRNEALAAGPGVGAGRRRGARRGGLVEALARDPGRERVDAAYSEEPHSLRDARIFDVFGRSGTSGRPKSPVARRAALSESGAPARGAPMPVAGLRRSDRRGGPTVQGRRDFAVLVQLVSGEFERDIWAAALL